MSCLIHGDPETTTPIIIVSETPVERFIHDLGARLSQCIDRSREIPGRVFDGVVSTILRAQAPRDAAHTGDTITPSPSTDGKILLAEDNEINRRLILELLRRAGLDATPARNGKEAWEYAAAHPYDLILLDLQMPEMDGFEAKKKIRETEKNRRTPIIALTAHAMKGDREKILGEGFDGYIAKPIAKRELYEEIAAHLETTPAPPPPSRSPFDAMSGLKKEFIDSLPAEVDRLESALAAEDYADIAKCAHDLKGLGGAFGQSQLSMLGRRIEAAAKEQNRDVLSLLVESLREESDHLVNDT
jgi:CheY-like chemotaxis protein